MNRSTSLLIFGVIAGTAVGVACGIKGGDFCDNYACGGEDSGTDAGFPTGCEVDPSKKSDCVSNDYGVFVSGAGSDSAGDGTKAKPVKTVAKALTLATGKPWIFVCEGNYTEPMTLARGIGVYGGLSCAGGNWSYSGGETKFAPSSGVALSIINASSAVTVADISFTAADAATAGESSIAGKIALSNGVTLRRVLLTAGAGADANPTRPTISDWEPKKASDGHGSDGGASAPEQPNACPGLVAPNDRSVGAAGGARNEDGGTGAPVIPPKPEAAYTGAGGDTTKSLCDGAARPGAYGAGGAQAPADSPLGRINASSYLPATGSAGGNGATGQGGGGGAGKNGPTAFGGGGGAGGCGGKGGAGGQAGGSSIALLVFRTSVSLESTKLHSAKAGQGGPGGKGQKAQEAGLSGREASGGCPGAQGGHGGSGAGGNGGAGGSSLNLVFTGTAPKIDGADLTDSPSLADKGWSFATAVTSGGAAGEKGEKVVADADEVQAGRPGPSGIIKAVTSLSEAP